VGPANTPTAQAAFFGSILAALAHFALGLPVSWPGPDLPFEGNLASVSLGFNASTALVILAAHVAAWSARVFATMRGSREFARNRVALPRALPDAVRVDQRLAGIQQSRTSRTRAAGAVVMTSRHSTRDSGMAAAHARAEWYG